jgi:molecular chaperone DnaK (HSP70)
MPARSSISRLPKEIREAFEKKLISGGFCDYAGLAAWLTEQGFEISRAAAHRYGQEFENKLSAIKLATEQARAITEAVGDEEGVMGDALTRLCQEKAFQALIEMQESAEISLPSLGRMISDLNRTAISQKKWMVEAREKAKSTADDITKTVKSAGLSEEKAEEIRKKILGIV